MRVPVSWLREFVDIADASTSELDAALVRQGLEVEAIHDAGLRGPLVVGAVRAIEELTEFRKPIRHCQVDVGEAEPRSIVCGATNFQVGDLVTVALPGAMLPGGFAISARKTYGRVSDGMICSARELGLGDDPGGILVLDPGTAAPGADAVALLGLDETVIELAITPDMAHCLSLRGVAREVSHALAATYRDPAALVASAATSEPPYPVQVADPRGCDRFAGRAIRGIDPQRETPQWMKSRLTHAGMRPISLVVDITNYVMLELGQPMHAFDLAKLSGPIVVRRGQRGEQVTTLDGVTRAIDPDDLLITDDTGPIGLAAVMGGATTEISAATTDVLIECAHWDPVSVARTARRHKLPSEAAKRFERGVDSALGPVAAERAVQLLSTLAGGVIDDRVLDLDARQPTSSIDLDVALPGRIAGVDYAADTVRQRLIEIGCVVADGGRHAGGTLSVTPPSWRVDLTDPYDLVEEVIRLEGYDAIPSLLPATPESPGLSPRQRRDRAVAISLAEAGFTEVLCYPFVAPSVHDHCGLAPEDPRRAAYQLANPLSDAEPELRTSLLPGLLAALRRNVSRGQRDVALFEIGRVFPMAATAPPAPRLGVDRRPSDAELAALFAAVPDQPMHLGVVLTGAMQLAGWWGAGQPADWSDAIAAVRLIAERAGAELTVTAAEYAPWHPGRCARFTVDGGPDGPHIVGHAGELHPRVCAALGLPPRTCAAELDLATLPVPAVTAAPRLSAFPSALQDVALVVDATTPAVAVEQALVTGAGELLEDLRLFDVFTGAQIGQGRKSLAYALTFRAADRTLTAEEVTVARDAAIAEAARQVGAELRR